jgi:hypothetical protein
VLRAQGSRGWNDFRTSIEQTCYIRDAWSRYTEEATGKLTTSSTHVNLYLNGLYWGLYNPVEHPDAEFLEAHLGGRVEDYDALNARVGTIEVLDGSREAWDALIAQARAASVSTLGGYREIERSLDVVDLADYMLINFYTGNQDWVGSNGNNMRVVGGPSVGVGFKAFCWDMEYSIWNAGDNILGVRTDYDTPAALHARLATNPEYRLLFADRARKHFFGGGALTPQATAERWEMLANQIEGAIVGESARWGDRRREPPYTRDVEWMRERQRLLTTYFPQRTGILLGQLTQAGLYPQVAAPEFSPEGGAIGPGFALTIAAPSGGAILYRIDGGDPRLAGGAPAPEAIPYGAPLSLSETTRVRARVRSGTTWSALSEATLVGDTSALRVTEIMYHPPPPESEGPFDREDFEFLELQNTGEATVGLLGVKISGGVEFTFPDPHPGSKTSLEPGEVVIVVKSREAFSARYGTEGIFVAGEYSGNLSNAGDRIIIEDLLSRSILDFSYSDDWQRSTDGGGPSLEILNPRAPAAAWSLGTSWRASRVLGGTPGAGPSAGGLQRPGDINQDGGLDISDAVGILGHLFLGSPSVLPCGDGTLASEGNISLIDTNGDEEVDLTDAVYALLYLFGGGPPPASGTGCVPIPACVDACRA